MRVDHLRAHTLPTSTWLLAVCAGWALIAIMIALAGLGGRYELHPDAPGLAPALPQLALNRARERLGPPGEYAEVGERSLFSEDRRASAVQTGQAEGQGPLDVVLSGVIITDQLKLAIVQDAGGKEVSRVRLNQALDNAPSYTLVELAPRRAVFAGPQGRTALDLRLFNGQGGEAPTALAPPPQPAARTVTPRLPTALGPVAANPQPGQAVPPTPEGGQVAPLTPEQQAELIRQRIQQRREQLSRETQAQEGNR